MKIDHSVCKYFYQTECEKGVRVYESLLHKDVDRVKIEMKDCCGLEPIGIMLDDEQPLCKMVEMRGKQ